MRTKQAAVSVLALAVLWGCGEKKTGDAVMMDSAAATTAPMPAESAATPAPAAAPSDAQIAAIVLAADSVDVLAGEQAEDKATNPKVKAFAQKMVTDHTAVNKLAGDLAQKLGLTPEDNPTAQALRQAGEQSRQQLAGLSGAAYDSAYIAHEIAYHQQVIDALDNTLIPSAQNPQLKDLLQKGRPIFEGHLEMAKQIQSSLGQS